MLYVDTKEKHAKKKNKKLVFDASHIVCCRMGGSYYVGIVSESRAESGLYAQQVSEPFVHPDISEIVAEKPFPAEGQYCLACHQGIEPTRPIGSRMMQQILEKEHHLETRMVV